MKTFIWAFRWWIGGVAIAVGIAAIPALFPLLTPQEETVERYVGGVCVKEVWAMPFGYLASIHDHNDVIEDMRAKGEKPARTMSCTYQVVT